MSLFNCGCRRHIRVDLAAGLELNAFGRLGRVLEAAFIANQVRRRVRNDLALLWQILTIDWRNWIPESDFQ